MPKRASEATLVSVNVGLPRAVKWRREEVLTSIWKTPVAGRVRVSRLNLEGDRQSDLSVHGGRDKAVYAYPSEHYSWWRSELPGVELAWGAFGENLSIAGLLESEVSIGDRLRIGTAEFIVTQPRLPCFKLGIRFGDPRMVKRFLASHRLGFYLKVVKPGELEAGVPVELRARAKDSITVADIGRLHGATGADPGLLRRVAALPHLSDSWREHFRRRAE